jgi:hypothetical protein
MADAYRRAGHVSSGGFDDVEAIDLESAIKPDADPTEKDG